MPVACHCNKLPTAICCLENWGFFICQGGFLAHHIEHTTIWFFFWIIVINIPFLSESFKHSIIYLRMKVVQEKGGFLEVNSGVFGVIASYHRLILQKKSIYQSPSWAILKMARNGYLQLLKNNKKTPKQGVFYTIFFAKT